MADRPNFLILLSDQHSPHIAGCYGDRVVRTPHIDALAERGVTFEGTYCQSPLCVPSRMSFLTSQQPSDIEVWTNSCFLPSDVPTFAHGLGAAAYETTLVGRMHFKGADQRHGFEHLRVGSVTPVDLFGEDTSLSPGLRAAAGHSRPAVTTAGPGRTGYQAYDEEVAGATADLLREKSGATDRPFCIVTGFALPHCPFVCPREDWDYYHDRVALPSLPDGYLENLHPVIKEWRKTRGVEGLTDEQIRRARAGYYGNITHLDRQVGVVLHALAETGLEKNTVVIYLSDHGEMAGEHGMWWKSNFFEASVGVPLVVSFPPHFSPARRREVVSLVDIGPTLLEMAGADPLPTASGASLVPLLEGRHDSVPRPAFSEKYPYAGTPPGRMIRDGNWKLVHHEGQTPMLFDLEKDPGELTDLGTSDAHATIRDALHHRVRSGWDPDRMQAVLAKREKHHPLLRAWYETVRPPGQGQWHAPDGANQFPL